MDRAIRLHLLARKIERTAKATADNDFIAAASKMRAKAEALAEIGLGHFADDPLI